MLSQPGAAGGNLAASTGGTSTTAQTQVPAGTLSETWLSRAEGDITMFDSARAPTATPSSSRFFAQNSQQVESCSSRALAGQDAPGPDTAAGMVSNSPANSRAETRLNSSPTVRRASSVFPGLRLGTYNCEGFFSAAQYVAELMVSLDILFLSETWLSSAEANVLPSIIRDCGVTDALCFQAFAMEVPPGSGEGRRRGGVAFICRCALNITFDLLALDSSRLLAISVSTRSVGSMHLVLLGSYMPYFRAGEEQANLYAETCAQIDAFIAAHHAASSVILLGDFNCALPRSPPHLRSYNWHRLRGFTSFSLELQHVLDAHELTIAEFAFNQPTQFTYERGGHRTHIDHIIVPANFICHELKSCSIVSPTSENLSPHLPIVCTLGVSGLIRSIGQESSSSTPDRIVLDWSDANRNQSFSDALALRLDSSIVQLTTATALDDLLTSATHAAALEAGCAKRWRPPKPWWTPVCGAARDRARFWFGLWTQANRPRGTVLHECFCTARRSYRRARREAASARSNQEARLLSVLRRSRQLKSFWARVERSRRGATRARSSLSAEEFAVHLSAVQRDDTPLTNQQSEVAKRVAAMREAARRNPGPLRVITPAEVAGLIPRLNHGASPGPDGITVEHLCIIRMVKRTTYISG